MQSTPGGNSPTSSGRVLELFPGTGGSTAQRAQTLRGSLDAFLDAAGWSPADLTPEQLRLIAGLMSERFHHLDTIRTLNDELDRLKSIADFDVLLPVFNRRAFLRELSRSLSFCQRHDTPACLIFIDLDNFKALNDRLGHSTGDDALMQLVRILKTHTRESDLIGRLGGDEFAVLLIGAEEDHALKKAENFAEDVRKLDFDETHPLDLSCGIVSWDENESPEHLIERGDEAMYLEKRRKQQARA